MPLCRFALLFPYMNYLLSICIDPVLVSLSKGASLPMSHSSIEYLCAFFLEYSHGPWELEKSSMFTQFSGLIGGGYKSSCWKHKVRPKYDNQTFKNVESCSVELGVGDRIRSSKQEVHTVPYKIGMHQSICRTLLLADAPCWLLTSTLC